MEEKKLDFKAPFLSVRRFPSKLAPSDGRNRNIIENSSLTKRHSIPSYKSDYELDQVTEPVAVPFMWEHIPGRAKSGSGPLSQCPEEPSVTPRLPPGRVLDAIHQPSKKELEDQNVFRPQTQTEASFFNDKLTKLESSKEGISEKGSFDLEDDDDAYSDALDTLSPTDSFSLSCSVSGLSGSDGLGVKPSGTFSTDPQTRDFMMNRFLPAAKAMALEPPHYVSRKQPVAQEQPRQVKKMVSGDRRPLLNRYGSNIIPYYSQDKEEEESEYDNDNYDDSSNISAKACGFLPRFCSKNSLCLLNPVPGMKVRTQVSKSSASEVGRLAKTAYIGSQSQTVDKHAWDAVIKRKLDCGVQSPELHEVRNKQTGESNHVTYSCDSQATDGSSSNRHLRGGGISPYRNEASQSPFYEGMGFLGVPNETENFKANSFSVYNKGCDNFREVLLLTHHENELGSGSMSPTVEKTLYIDSVNIVENLHSNSCSSDTKEGKDSAGQNVEMLVENRGMEETAISESSFQDIRCLNILEGGDIWKPDVSGPVDAYLPSYSDISDLRDQADTMEGFQFDRVHQDSGSLEWQKVPANGNLDANSEQNLKAEDPENSYFSSLQSVLPPPLPKSPSESWLWRTLPAVSSRNSFSYSRKLAPQTSSTGTKWETIVKTSKLDCDHVRYSAELISHVSKQSRT